MKIGVVGNTGRVGAILYDMLCSNGKLAGGINSQTSAGNIDYIIKNSDVIIDFSSVTGMRKLLEKSAEHNVPFVSGTTGLTDSDWINLKSYANIVPILHANNFSICVQLMSVLVKKCSDLLEDFDFSIVEKHHRNKKDSPSGTALFLEKESGRKAQIASIRCGNIFGEHECQFCGDNESITISHTAFNRKIFAEGAIACAKWIIGKEPKLYTMKDFLRDKISE